MRIAVFAALLAFATSTRAGEPVAVACLEDLVHMDTCQLLELYKSGSPGPRPEGFTPGRVMPNPGSKLNALRSKMLKRVWQGKNFDGDIMTNSFFGVKVIKGHVQDETSWIDGQPVHAIDYSQTSLIFRPYRDEIREVAPGIYLGIMWKRDDCKPKLVTWFAIDARGNCCECGK